MSELITILVHHMQSIDNYKNTNKWAVDEIAKYKRREARADLGKSLS